MVDYTYPTGAAGTMLIRDTGYNVEFHIRSGDSATNVGSLKWKGFINGSWWYGQTSYGPGSPWVQLATFGVGATQDVCFSIEATGTYGLGGPTDFWTRINRAPIATPPSAPTPLGVGDFTPTSFGVTYQRGSNNGAAITQDHAEWSRESDGVVVWDDAPFGVGPSGGPSGYSNPAGATPPLELTPGTLYRIRIRSMNSAGWGPFSTYAYGNTLGVGRVRNAGVYRNAMPYVRDGGVYKRAHPYVRDGGVYKRSR